MSAVSSVRTPGVLVTVTPRAKAAVTSILSTPLPKLAMSFICSPACPINSASILSVTVGTMTSARLQGLGEGAARHWLVVDIQPRFEKLAHAGFHNVWQFAGDDNERLFSAHSFPCPLACRARSSNDQIAGRRRTLPNPIAFRQIIGPPRRALPIRSSLGVNEAQDTRGAGPFIAYGLCSRWPVKDKNAGCAD